MMTKVLPPVRAAPETLRCSQGVAPRSLKRVGLSGSCVERDWSDAAGQVWLVAPDALGRCPPGGRARVGFTDPSKKPDERPD